MSTLAALQRRHRRRPRGRRRVRPLRAALLRLRDGAALARGSGEWAWAPARAGDDGALCRPRPSALTLPRIPSPPVVPEVLYLPGDTEGGCALAEALLAAGVLRESDWTGQLAPSIAAGVTRWGRELLDGGDLSRLEIALYWKDDVESLSGLDTRLWHAAKNGRVDEPVGLLALTCPLREPAEAEVVVGRSVRALENARRGLGFQVLKVLEEVLPPLVNAACPHYGWQQAQKHAWYYDRLLKGGQVPECLAPPTHAVGPLQYAQEVPLECWSGSIRPEVLRKALHLKLPPRQREWAVRALALLEGWQRLTPAARMCDSHLLCARNSAGFTMIDCPGGAAKMSPFTVRWSREDPLPRIVADFHRQIFERDVQTNLLWTRAVQFHDPAALRTAACHWRDAATLALQACRLAELMHTEESP
jgi:hypothetical protein